jgi:hypothetical protein
MVLRDHKSLVREVRMESSIVEIAENRFPGPVIFEPPAPEISASQIVCSEDPAVHDPNSVATVWSLAPEDPDEEDEEEDWDEDDDLEDEEEDFDDEDEEEDWDEDDDDDEDEDFDDEEDEDWEDDDEDTEDEGE